MTNRDPAVSTDRLIDSLVVELRPVAPFTVPARLTSGALVGAIVAMVLLFVFLGARPDLPLVAGTAAFWMKVAYTIGTAAAALFVASRISRPAAPPGVAWVLIVPLLLYLPVAIWELASTDRADWGSLLLGHGWRRPSWRLPEQSPASAPRQSRRSSTASTAPPTRRSLRLPGTRSRS